MNIGIYVPGREEKGGLHSYSLNILHYLKEYDKENKYYIFHTDKTFPYPEIEGDNWQGVYLETDNNMKVFKRFFKFLFFLGWKWQPRFAYKEYNKIMEYNIHLLFCPVTFSFVIGYYCHIPTIVSIHDMQHRYINSFPAKEKIWKDIPFNRRIMRDIIYKKAAKFAKIVLVDSVYTKNDLIKFYKIPKEKIEVLPYYPPYHLNDATKKDISEIRQKYNLPDKYIFYPAQFWYHKNHKRVVKALYRIKEKRKIEIPLVLVGSEQTGALKETLKIIEELGLAKQIRYLGYVPDEDIGALYKLALCLCMPNFFGPTNIPFLEAFSLGCPVIASNVRGQPEQIGDAGILVNPYSVEEIADAIYKLYTNDDLRKELIERGYKRIKELTSKNYGEMLFSVIQKAIKLL